MNTTMIYLVGLTVPIVINLSLFFKTVSRKNIVKAKRKQKTNSFSLGYLFRNNIAFGAVSICNDRNTLMKKIHSFK